MRKYLLLLLSMLFFHTLHAQDSLGNITELKKLLQERKDRFSQYSAAAEMKSGIFGNKTKKDLEHSRDILIEIVKTDNHLLTELDKAIEKRGIAKADYSFDEVAYKQTIENLANATDTLNIQLAAVKDLNIKLNSSLDREKWLRYTLLSIIGLLAAFLFILFRRRKSNKA